MARPAHPRLFLALALACGGTPVHADALAALPQGSDPVLTERAFRDGMTNYSAGDYRRAEALFRSILDRNPRLLRVRLELARTLYMAKKYEQADYHFGLAAAEHPSAAVARNIARFREAIRSQRSLRFNFEMGLAPDSNINSATDKETVDIHGLPFRLDDDARARTGTGVFVGGNASAWLNRSGKLPIYVGAYGRWTRHADSRFDDAYAGAEAGPEFELAGGRLRATATGLMRWYGRRHLVTSLGARLSYDKLIGDNWNLSGSLLVRRNDYARRSDVDGWDVEAGASVSRPLGSTTLGLAHMSLGRSWANDPGQSYLRKRVGIGVLKEIGWGLRPQLGLDLTRQAGDGPLAPFGKRRRDWQLQGSFSIYKRDWNVMGFAPSVSLTVTRNHSTLPLYDERRMRGEIRATKAF